MSNDVTTLSPDRCVTQLVAVTKHGEIFHVTIASGGNVRVDPLAPAAEWSGGWAGAGYRRRYAGWIVVGAQGSTVEAAAVRARVLGVLPGLQRLKQTSSV